MSDRIRALIEAQIPEDQQPRALELYAFFREDLDDKHSDNEIFCDIKYILEKKGATMAFAAAATGTLAIASFTVLVVDSNLTIDAATPSILGLFGLCVGSWYAVYKLLEIVIERRAMKELMRAALEREELRLSSEKRGDAGAGPRGEAA